MDANKILNADFLDILFEGRNKSYGAYELRKTYNSRIIKALIAIGSLLVLLLLAFLLVGFINSRTTAGELNVEDTEIAQVNNEPPPPPPPPPPPVPPPPPEIKQVQFTPPKVVKDNEVKPDEKIQEIKEDQAISTKTVETENTQQVVQAPVEDKGTQAVEAPKADDENKVFTSVQVEASFPGGPGAYRKYLEKNLSPEVATDHNAPPGSYTVNVKFIVSKDGSISDVQATTSNGYGMEDEAIRVIKRSPKWVPAQQNGTIVNAYRVQPITFVVAQE